MSNLTILKTSIRQSDNLYSLMIFMLQVGQKIAINRLCLCPINKPKILLRK